MSDWIKTGDLLKQLGAVGGLPRKVVHVDSDTSPRPQTGGMLYEAELLNDAVAAEPALKCPNCGQPVTGIAGAKTLYQVDVREGPGKSHKADVPDCPVAWPWPVPVVFVVDPCGCRVTQDWASAFSAELSSRIAGRPPKPLALPTAAQTQKRIDQLTDKLSQLYSVQANPVTVERKRAADYWSVIVADQIQRLVPGGHNTPRADTPLNSEVVTWANANSFAKPPDQAVPVMPAIGGGSPVYRMSNGTVSSVPAYPGQEPCGIAQGPPGPKTKPPPPELFQDNKGQWKVRYNNQVRAFLSHGEAKGYADKLDVGPEPPEKKPTLQTLPAESQSGEPPRELLENLHAFLTDSPSAAAVAATNWLRSKNLTLTPHAVVTVVRNNLGDFLDGTETSMTRQTESFIEHYVETFGPPPPKSPPIVAAPSGAVPAAFDTGPDRGARKKRTIRKLSD